MPEVTPPKNLELYRQCEVRRPSLAATLIINGQEMHKPAGYYFDVVWIRNDIARPGRQVIDGNGQLWVIAEAYGAKPMAGNRWEFRLHEESMK